MTNQANGPGRKIILLSDGTGNSSGKLFKTNVWRLYSALDVSNASQLAYYNNGVGTSAIKPLALLGGAFGWGLKRNVLELYTFLCRNYRPGDRIYGFGFSRGAFTIRVLMNFILSQGLVSAREAESTDDLRRKAVRLYRRFRAKRTRHYGLYSIARGLRDSVVWMADCVFRGRKYDTFATIPVPKIEFLGLWDTVSAYGMPVEEIERGIDRYIWPLSIDDRTLHPGVNKACHALSIDDRRQIFHPLLWDETGLPEENSTDQERLTQVWFAGVHANVGGGYPDDSLSSITLRWMINEAHKRDLKFNDQAVAEIDSRVAPYGPIYNSRAGFGAYYRYGPRFLNPPRDGQGACIAKPKIHETVIWRMVAGADAYAPLSLPADARIVVGPGKLEGLNKRTSQSLTAGRGESNILKFEDYRASVLFGSLYGAPAGEDATPAKKQRAASEFVALDKPDDDTLALIWATVWWRRIAYYATLMATALLLFWIFDSGFRAWLDVKAGSVDDTLRLGTAPLVRAVALFTPAFLSSYVQVLDSHPLLTILLIGMTLSFLSWGTRLDRRISDRALAAWNENWRSTRYIAFRRSMRMRVLTLIVLLILTVVPCVLLFALSAYFVSQPPCVGICFISDRDMAIVSAIVGVFFLTLAVPVAAWGFSLLRIWRRGEMKQKEIPGVALWTANKLRNSRVFGALHSFVTRGMAPALSAGFLLLAGVYFLNRVAFDVVSASGWICTTEGTLEVPDEPITITFSTKSLCHRSEFLALADVQYVINVSDVKDWGEDGLNPPPIKIGPQGFATSWLEAPATLLTDPMKRIGSQPRFRLMARFGEAGESHVPLVEGDNTVKAPKSGEIFFFVNDAVVGLPRYFDTFYSDNKGTAKITISRDKK